MLPGTERLSCAGAPLCLCICTGCRYVDDPDISIGMGNQWVAGVLRDQLEPLFAKYQVDMTWVSSELYMHSTRLHSIRERCCFQCRMTSTCVHMLQSSKRKDTTLVGLKGGGGGALPAT